MKDTKLKKFITAMMLNLIAYLIGLIWILPLIGLVMASVRPYSEIVSGWWQFQEFHMTLENFINAWNSQPFPLGYGFINSFIVTIPSSLIPLLAGALAAYGFLRFNFPLRDYFFMMLVIFFCNAFTSYSIACF